MVMKLALSLLLLLALCAFAAADSGAAKKKGCRPCKRGGECASGVCASAKCAPTHDAKSVAACNLSCTTPFCEFARCVGEHGYGFQRCKALKAAMKKSMGGAGGSRKAECAICSSVADCSTRFCGGAPRRCHDGTPQSLGKCFKKACASCRSKYECASRRCEQGKCVYNTMQSRRACGLLSGNPKPPPTSSENDDEDEDEDEEEDGNDAPVAPRVAGAGMKNCKPCVSASSCASGECTDGLCGPPLVVLQCPGRECSPCQHGWQCAGKQCKSGRCSDGSEESLTRCGLSRECAACRGDYQCAAGRCVDGVCSDGSPDSMVRCGFNQECAPCADNKMCATRRCVQGMCIKQGVQASQAVMMCDVFSQSGRI